MVNDSIKMNIELVGYDKMKEQLNDIENQIDRIIEKVNVLSAPNTELSPVLKEMLSKIKEYNQKNNVRS